MGTANLAVYFSGTPTIYDPTSAGVNGRVRFANNIILQAGYLSLKVLSFYPQQNVPGIHSRIKDGIVYRRHHKHYTSTSRLSIDLRYLAHRLRHVQKNRMTFSISQKG